MSARTLGIVAVAIGLLLFLVSLGADALGIGPHPGFGLKQAAGAIVGGALVAFGIFRLRSR
ncbi:MAG: hypothetical protein ACRD2Z_17920 [Thermoanaerobaculia bacterium]